MEAENPKVCNQQAGDPGELMVWVAVGVWVQRQGKTDVPAPRHVWQRESKFFLGYSACCSIQAFRGLDETHPHPAGQSALLSLPFQMLISPGTHSDTPRIVFNQISGHSVAQSTWHIKLIITATKRHRRIPNNWEKKGSLWEDLVFKRCQFSVYL